MAEKYLTYTGLKTYDGLIKDWTLDQLEGIEAAGTILGYYHEGAFYEDDEYTTELEGKANFLYVDQGDNNKLYVYKNDAYELVSDSGSAEVSIGETTVACGGIAKGTDLTGKSLQEILEMMISPYVAPSNVNIAFTKTKDGSTPYNGAFEHGETCYIPSVTVSWTAGSQNVEKVNLDGFIYHRDLIPSPEGATSVTLSGLSKQVTDQSGITNTHASLKITGKSDVIRTQAPNVPFVYPVYYGMSQYGASDANLNVQTLTKLVESGISKTLHYTGTDAYPIIASIYRIAKVTDSSGITDYTNAFIGSETQVTLSSVNPSWGPITYYVYNGSRATLDDFVFKFTF